MSTDKITSAEYFRIRDEELKDLQSFSKRLGIAVVTWAEGNLVKLEKVNANLSARCPRCEIPVSGSELLGVAISTGEEPLSAKIQRMQLGYCARNGCNASTYKIYFRNDPVLDWPGVFAELERTKQNAEQHLAASMTESRATARAKQWKCMGRVAIGCCVIVLLLGAWQWRRGGRIPVIREPEKFRVTPLANGETESSHY